MNATVLGLLLISNSLELDKIGALFFFQHVELLLDSLLFIFEKLLLELIDLLLFVLIDVVKFALFEVVLTVLIDKGEAAVLFGPTEAIGGDWRQGFASRDAI